MIHFICAMRCEAKPILEHLRLQPYSEATLFPLFLDNDKRTSLTITGTGKLAAAAATMYTLSQLNAEKSDAWLNVGIAGHNSHEVGQALLANRIEDVAAAMTWYPQIVFDAGLPCAGMQTLDKPSTHYNDNLYEMEGAGFYASAIRAGTSELIHCLKVVSDNHASSVDRLTEQVVSCLIADNIGPIMAVHDQLSRLSHELGSNSLHSPYFDRFIQRWHFTQYQRGTLQQLLNRWHVLKPGEDPLDIDGKARDAGALLIALAQILDAVPIRFGAREK